MASSLQQFVPFGLAIASLLGTCTTSIQAEQLSSSEQLPPGTRLVRIEASPAAIVLPHRYAYSQVLLTGVTEAGDRLDVTRMAAVEAPAGLVDVSTTRLVRPLADGVRITHAG